MSLSKVDRLTLNQGQNDHWPILHISLNTFYQRKWFVFVTRKPSIKLYFAHVARKNIQKEETKTNKCECPL